MNLQLFRNLYCRVDDAYGAMTPDGPRTIRFPLTDDLIRKHLEGGERIGAFFIDPEGMADQLVIDIDIQDPELAKNVRSIFDELGIYAYVEASKSKGYHIRTHWDCPVKASDLRRIGSYVTKESGIPKAEIFPKQDQRREENGLGNFMWLPLHGLSWKEGKTAVVDHTNGMCPLNDQWAFMESIRRNSTGILRAAIAIVEDDEPEGRTQVAPETYTSLFENKIPDGKRNSTLTSLAGAMRRKGATAAAIHSALKIVNADKCLPPLSENEVRGIAQSMEKYPPAQENEKPILDRQDPMKNVQQFLDSHFHHEEGRTLHHHKGAFYEWSGTHYPQMDDGKLRSLLYDYLSKAKCWVKKGEDMELDDFKPTRKTVDDAVDALKAVAHLGASRTSPMWINGENETPAGEIIACKNGLVHLPTKRLIPHSPCFFTHNVLPFDYLPDSGPATLWHRFLDDLWGEDKEAQDALQEIFGYLISGETRLQKIFLIVGPKRSGKGTMGRVLTGLLGQENVCAPTLAGLQTQFGHATLIGKMAAIISDARLGGRADQHVIAERLLTISGEDTTTVQRKYLPDWNGHHSVRFVILTNELPRIADSSGALASRLIVLTLKNSFFGKEDPGLTDTLLGELPKILNWAIEGLARLRQRGYFLQPSSSQDSIQDLEDLSSPISAFIRDCIDIGSEFEVERPKVFTVWKKWCEEQGRDYPGTDASFGRDLRAYLPRIGTRQPTENGKRKRVYTGIKVNDACREGLEIPFDLEK